MSWLGKLRRSTFKFASRPIQAFINLAIRDEPTYAWLLHTLGNRIAMAEFHIESRIPRGLTEIKGFEDCVWLFSSNPLNHGSSRLRFDEGAYLFKLIQSMEAPHCAELGRYKGGTTLLMAVSGAQVISIDNCRIFGQRNFTDPLISTLRRFELDDNVEVVDCDVMDYPITDSVFDLVFLDVGLDSYEVTEKMFNFWWSSLKDGGYFLFRDGKQTVLKETASFVSELSDQHTDCTFDFDLPGAFVLCTKQTFR